MKFWALATSLVALTSCSGSPSQEDGGVGGDNVEMADLKPVWKYSEHVDKMRGHISWTATLKSSNRPELEFPYEGGSPTYLRLSKLQGDPSDNYGPEIVLENGQFDCSLYGGGNSCLITVKVDDEKPRDLRGVSSDCGSAKCLRLFDEAAIEQGGQVYQPVIDMFRRSKHVTIELPLYQYGSYQYEFDTQNLQWARQTDRR
jgi:hypothetical protein